MLKEVGASGQIFLGKRLAGQLFDVVFYPSWRIELLPVRAVASAVSVPPPIGIASNCWLPPGGDKGFTQWALDNRAALEAYARGIEQNGTLAEQLQGFLSDQSAPSAHAALRLLSKHQPARSTRAYLRVQGDPTHRRVDACLCLLRWRAHC